LHALVVTQVIGNRESQMRERRQNCFFGRQM
jgi:hypothetical protein